MTKAEITRRMRKLEQQIDDYRYRYHVLNDPTVTDEVYDSLTRELKRYETDYPELSSPDSPTQRVGGEPLAQFTAVPHETPMLSLNDITSREELEAWITRLTKLLPTHVKPSYHADIKMDGLACGLVYEKGRLVRGLTRGDGRVGEDVTMNIRTIHSVPLRLRRDKAIPAAFYSDRVEVRGEVLLYKKDFAAINKEREAKGLPLFMNPRNTAAGTVRQLDPKLVAARPLKFHAYSVLHESIKTHADEYQRATQLGFIVNSQHRVLHSVDEIMKFVKHWEDKRHELPFNTDGLVVTVNERELFSRLGVVGKAPRGAIAYKYPPEQVTTKLKDIFISIGRTGAATPVAMLEPVVIAGTLVQMATLHNEGEIHRKDIRIGDTVVVHKAGDIIPEVVEPLPKLRSGSEKKFVMPVRCPECNTLLIRETLRSGSSASRGAAEQRSELYGSGTANEQAQAATKRGAESNRRVSGFATEPAIASGTVGAVWRCPNTACPARLHNQIQHFASKAALDIEGLGEKNVIALLDAGLIHDAADLYSLKKDSLLKLERFADVSASKLVKAIQAKKRPTLARFIYGLGIRHIGAQTAVDLANHFRSLDALRQATVEDLLDVANIGEVVAESIVAWFAEPTHRKLLDKFAARKVAPDEVKKVGGPLSDKSFVITGTLDSMSREEAGEKIRSLGGTFQSSVGEETDYLIVGANVGASKLAKAAKLGTKQIKEADFLKLIQEGK